MTLTSRFFCWAVFSICFSLSGACALTPPEILVLVNKDVGISSDVARMYLQLRRIPSENVLRLSLGSKRDVSREQYRKQIAPPVKKFLSEHAPIQCIVTTAGFPYLIQNTPGTQDGAAIDNELAAVLREEPKDWNRWQPNPLFLRGPDLRGNDDPRAFQMVYVTRLDGPDLKTITRIVEDAIAAEIMGIEGPAFGDAGGGDGQSKTGPAGADLSIRAAIDHLSGAGFPSTFEFNLTKHQPAGGVGEQAAGAAFYIGWDNQRNFQNIFGKQGLARGAIAWHVAGGDAANLWDLNSKEWCGNLMRRGVAVTLGSAFEPEVSASPKADVFVESLLLGKTVAESYWLALPHVSWAMVILGDPLYRPFAMKPRPTLVARAYVAGNATHVLEKGQASPLLIELECVGPASSGTPDLTAVAEAGAGLAAASGTVSIPALQSGQTAVVRVPGVQASDDQTGMFRLYLNVQQNEGDRARRIVLEGRTGFATISGGLYRQTLMFVSPGGEFVIGGQAGKAYLTDTATLQSKQIAIAEGWGVLTAAFASDGAHFELTLLNPETRQVTFAIVDSKTLKSWSTPEGTLFLRWMSKDTMLLKGQSGLVVNDINLATSLPIFDPPGWSVNNIIPETATQLLLARDSRFAVKHIGDEVHEILLGTGVTHERAVANDLSLFGGIDDQKRLWIQHGFQSSPEVIAQDVNKVTWGPVSRRVLVEEASGSFRIYDGRDRSWLTLPALTAAQWSPDETRLLFLEAEHRDGTLVPRFLSLLTDRRTEQLCDLNRIGEIGKMTFSNNGDMVFLLAGTEAGRQIGMMSLPRTVQGH